MFRYIYIYIYMSYLYIDIFLFKNVYIFIFFIYVFTIVMFMHDAYSDSLGRPTYNYIIFISYIYTYIGPMPPPRVLGRTRLPQNVPGSSAASTLRIFDSQSYVSEANNGFPLNKSYF